MSGEIQYSDHSMPVPASALSADIRGLVKRAIERAAGAAPTQKTPSHAECRFCDITAVDCPERVDEEPIDSTPVHDLFR
jgi:hypothetical protein